MIRNNIENWKDTAKILEFLGLKFDFENEGNKNFPFNRKPEDLQFYSPYMIIPEKGIEEAVLNKLADNRQDEERLEEVEKITMMVNIPFLSKKDSRVGCVVVDLSLGFEYDKEYKYGDITRNKAQCCYAIMKYAKKTNNFYVIDSMSFGDFMSYYVIPNQWGIGAKKTIDMMLENINNDFVQTWED